MYSELWVDPDAEEREGARDGRGDGHKIQFLFKMDLPQWLFGDDTGGRKGAGGCECLRPGQCDSPQQPDCGDLGQILPINGLKGRSVQVQKHTRPLTLTEVFPGTV